MRDVAVLRSTLSGMTYQVGHPFRIGTRLAYEAQDTSGRKYWIKQVPSDDEAAVAQLRYEAMVLGKLDHPNVVRMVDRGRNHVCFFLVLEPVVGVALPQLVESEHLTVARVCTMAVDLAKVLVHLHKQGVLGCSLPPKCFYVDHLHQIQFVDLSAVWDQQSPLHIEHAPRDAVYLSPEEASGAMVDHRSDIYVFGVLLFELLTGRPPFQGTSRSDLALQHMLTQPPELRDIKLDIPPELAALVHKCLAKSPNQRPSNAAALLTVLEHLDYTAPKPVAQTTGRLSWRWMGR